MTNMRTMAGRREADDTTHGTRLKKDETMETLSEKTSEIEPKSEGKDRKEMKTTELKDPTEHETETLIQAEQCEEIRTEMSLV